MEDLDLEKAKKFLEGLEKLLNDLRNRIDIVRNRIREANEALVYRYGSLGRLVFKKYRSGNSYRYKVYFEEILSGKRIEVEDKDIIDLFIERNKLLSKYISLSKRYKRLKKLLKMLESYEEILKDRKREL